MNTQKIRLIEIQECASTNDEAWSVAKGISPYGPWNQEFILISAQRQTKGRGRQGRQWHSETQGNLYASLLMPPPDLNSISLLSWVPLAAGVAAMEALLQARGKVKISHSDDTAIDASLHIKWPNDLMWNQSKIGGILCESRFAGDHCQGVVVGLGLNIASSPSLENFSTENLKTVLEFQKLDLNPEIFKAIFQRQWAETLRTLIAKLYAGDTESIRTAWNQWAKLEKYPSFTMHTSTKEIRNVKGLELTENGKLKAMILDQNRDARVKMIYLDQADTI